MDRSPEGASEKWSWPLAWSTYKALHDLVHACPSLLPAISSMLQSHQTSTQVPKQSASLSRLFPQHKGFSSYSSFKIPLRYHVFQSRKLSISPQSWWGGFVLCSLTPRLASTAGWPSRCHSLVTCQTRSTWRAEDGAGDSRTVLPSLSESRGIGGAVQPQFLKDRSTPPSI